MAEPWLTLVEAKAQVRVDTADDDALLTGFIGAARDYIEDYTGQVLEPEARAYVFDALGAGFLIPQTPVRGVVSITYLDGAGAVQVLPVADYRIVPRNGAFWVYPAFGVAWPAVAGVTGAVTVTADMGPLFRDDLALSLRQAGLLLIGHWYRNREGVSIGSTSAEVDFAVKALLAIKRFWRIT